MRKSNTGLFLLLNALGLLFSILPPALAILFYFPVWVNKGGEYVLSGIAVLLMIIAFVPLFKLLKKAFETPSGYAIWLLIFVVFLTVSRISSEMITVSFIGFIGNLIGAILFKIARRYRGNAG